MDHLCALMSLPLKITSSLGFWFVVFFFFPSRKHPRDSFYQFSEQAKVWSSESHVFIILALFLLRIFNYIISWSLEWRLLLTNHITHFYSQIADLAHLTSQLLPIQHLHQNIVLDALQKSPDLLASNHVALPADFGVVEVLHDNLVLQPWDFFMCFEAFHELFDQEISIQCLPWHSPWLSLLKSSLKSSWSACHMFHSKAPRI